MSNPTTLELSMKARLRLPHWIHSLTKCKDQVKQDIAFKVPEQIDIHKNQEKKKQNLSDLDQFKQKNSYYFVFLDKSR